MIYCVISTKMTLSFRTCYLQMKSHMQVLTLLLCVLCADTVDLSSDPRDFGIVIDAGSSGSRIYVYAWTASHQHGSLPDITEVFQHKTKPGISRFVGDSAGLQMHITQLIESCEATVPKHLHATTPIYLMATGGMRLLLEQKANQMFKEIDTIFKKSELNPFLYSTSNSRILSGEEEGAFAWIAVNYLRGFFNNKAYESVGILEMGGASTQITFIPAGNLLAFKFPVRVAGRRYDLYSHSYLYYGQETMDARMRRELSLKPENSNKTVIHNPCMLKDDTYIDKVIKPGFTLRFNGSGDPTECVDLLNVYLNKVPASRCYPKPCAIGPAYQPSIGAGKPFYGLGGYVKNIKPRAVLDAHDQFAPSDLRTVSIDYCKKTLDEAKQETGRTDSFLSVECMMGLYIPRLLTYSYGFSNKQKRITVSDMIGNKEAHWALGAVIYELEKQDRLCLLPGPMAASISAATELPSCAAPMLICTMTVVFKQLFHVFL